ncbi:unnamed protein product [Prorocentrum cordatum]|uniref:Uncharacterized protein n=1 Tax=Prorocentrum cordatum TaxID=2364126 RepID=A0ABN9WBJ9_9DINO|nr:unnamed protein product [Polarella glacialis]
MGGKRASGAAASASRGPPKSAARRGGRGSACASDSGFCHRREQPVDVASSKRGGHPTAPWIGCDNCWVTFERRYCEDNAWPDICERSREDPDFSAEFGARVTADLELESQVATAAERGSVEVVTYYGQEVSTSMVQLTPKQWASQVAPRGTVGITPEMCDLIQSRPYVSIRNYTRTEVRMASTRLTPQQAVKAGAETDAVKRDVTKLRQQQAVAVRGFAKVPTITELQNVALAKASAAGMLPKAPPPKAKAAVDDPLMAIGNGTLHEDVESVFPGASGGQRAGGAAHSPAGAPSAGMDSGISASSAVALHISSQPLVKAKSGAAASHPGQVTARFDGYKNDLVIHEILDGSLRGDRSYGLKRFKPKSPSLSVMVNKLTSKVEAASALSTNSSTMQWTQVLTHLKELSPDDVEATAVFRKTLLKKFVQHSISDDGVVIETLIPWSPHPDDFDMTAPKVSSMKGMSDSEKVDLVREVLLDDIVLPQLEDPARVTFPQAIGKLLKDTFPKLGDQCPSEIAEFCKHVQALGMLLFHLPNNDPLSFAECDPHMGVMIALWTGVTDAAEWHPVAEVLGDSAPWADYKSTFRRAASTDIQLAPRMKKTIEQLETTEGNTLEGIEFMSTVLVEIGSWRKVCRGSSRSTGGAGIVMQGRLEKATADLLGMTADSVDVKVGEALVELYSKFARVKGFEPDTADDPCGSKCGDLINDVDHASRCRVEGSFRKIIEKYNTGANCHQVATEIKAFVEENKGMQMPLLVDAEHLVKATLHVADHIGLLLYDAQLDTLGAVGDLIQDAIDKHALTATMLSCVTSDPSFRPSLGAVSDRLADAFSVIQVAKYAVAFYEAGDEDAAELRSAWERLDSSLDDGTPCASKPHDDILQELGCSKYEGFVARAEKWHQVAKDLWSEYAQSQMDQLLGEGRVLFAVLQKLSGGMLNGSHFMDGFAGEATDFAQTIGHLKVGLFKQTGVSNRLKDAHRAVQHKLGHAVEEPKRLKVPLEKWQATHDQWRDGLAKADVTLTTAAIAQRAKDRKTDEVTKANLQRALDQMQARKVNIESLPASVWEQAQQTLAA